MSAFWVRGWADRWLASPASRAGRATGRGGVRAARLGVQRLEARDVPATVTSAGGVLTFTAGAGVANAVSVSLAGTDLTFTDTAEVITTGVAGATGSGTNSVTVSAAGVTGVELALADGVDTVNAVTLGARGLTVGHAGGGLTLAAPVSTTNGNVAVSSTNGLTVAANLVTGTGTIALAANTDGAGAEGFSQTAGTITTTSVSDSALTIAVNTASGGTGSASLDDVTVGPSATTGGRLTINTNAGSVVYAPGVGLSDSQLGLVRGGAAPARLLRARDYDFASTGAGSIGTPDRPLQVFNFGLDGATGDSDALLNAGSGGVYFVKWSGVDLQLAGAKTSGAGGVRVVTANVGGNNLRVNGNVAAQSGNIFLGADDDFVVSGTSVIGGAGFSGTVFILANRDEGTPGQALTFAPGTAIVTSSTVNQANPEFFSPTTQAVYLQISGDAGAPSNLAVANITTGAGGRVVLNAVPNGAANVAPGPEAGRIQMASAANVINVGAAGDVRLFAAITATAAADAIGTAAVPLRVAGGKVEFDANFGNVTIAGAAATSFAGSTKAEADGQAALAGGLIALSTEAGALTVSGTLTNVNSGPVALRGAGGVVVAAGATLGGAGSGGVLVSGGLSGTGAIAIGGGDLTVLQSGDSTFAGAISGPSNTKALVKQGGGTLTLSGSSGFAGVAVVSAGDLRLTGSLTGTGGVAVQAGGVFSGTGKAAGPVAVAGKLAPGLAGTGTLGGGNLSFTAGSQYLVEAGTTAGDQVAVTGTASLAGDLRVVLAGTPSVGTSYTIVANDGTDAVAGAFANAANGSTVRAVNATGYAFTLNTAGGDGNDVTLTLASIDVFATGLLDVQSGQLQYFAAAGVNNNLGVTLSGGAFTVSDGAGAVVLGSGAIAAGYTLAGGVATGPAAGIGVVTVNFGDGTDALAALDAGTAGVDLFGTSALALNGAVSSGAAITIADFARVGGPGTLSAPGGTLVTGSNTASLTLGSLTATAGSLTVRNALNLVAQDAASVVSAGSLSLSADNAVGTPAAPIRTGATTLTVAGGAGGVFVSELDGVDVIASATGAGGVTIANGTGTLNVASAISLASGNIALASGDGVTLSADISTGSGAISILANTDGAGAQGYDQKGATVTTGNATASALTIAVNTASGGTGDAVIGKGTIGGDSGGTATVSANAGRVLFSNDASYAAFTASQTGLANGGSNAQTLKAAAYILSGAAVGADDRPIQIDNFGVNGPSLTPQLSGAAGVGGFYVTGWDAAGNRDLTAGGISAKGAGGVRVVTANAGGHNLYVTGTITAETGVIHLAADDNLEFQPNALVGGAGYSGSVYLQGNRDLGTGGQPVTFDKTAAIVTASVANQDLPVGSRTFTTQAVYIDVAGGTDAGPGVIQVANVTAGDGGRVVLNGVSPLSNAQSGLIRMADASNVISVGAAGTVELIGTRIDLSTTTAQNVIGAATLPVRVAGGTVVVAANFGNAYVTGNAATKFVAATTARLAGQTAPAVLALSTAAGLLTVSGPVSNANGGAVTLTGAAGVALAAGVTLGGTGTGAIAVTGGLSGTGTVSLGTGDLTVNQAVSTEFGGAVTGSKGLVKLGAGVLTLSGASSYAGATTITAGALALSGGSLSGTGAVTAAAGATLGGSGAVAGPVALAGTLSPGLAATGKLGTGSLGFSTGGRLAVDLNGTAIGTGYDQVDVTGAVNLSGATLELRAGFTAPGGAKFIVIANDGTDAVTGQFLSAGGTLLAEGATVTANGQNFTLSYAGGDGNDVTLTAAAAASPPAVVGPVAVNRGDAQRSRVTTLTVTFDQAVNLAADAFTLTQIGLVGGGASSALVPSSQIVVTLRSGTTATYDLTFTGTGLVESQGLADGLFQLRVTAAAVTGQSGGQPLASDFVTPSSGADRIARLFGDATGDGTVSNADLFQFRQAFNSGSADANYRAFLDADQDGQITNADLFQLRARFNRSV